MATILLLGLEGDLAEQLALILHGLSHEVVINNSLDRTISERQANIVFAAGDGPAYRDTICKLMTDRPHTPVIVVNRFPENGRWLDALELGASDYCGAPFENVQINWLVEGALKGRQQAAA